ncbi:MAG TPA: FHA domain-containing protein, partial [Nannocystis sp.]
MIEIKVESPGQAPRVQRFSSTVITVGRATDCELCVDDPSISRRHCRISRAADGWFLEDLGSANGTGVAGE